MLKCFLSSVLLSLERCFAVWSITVIVSCIVTVCTTNTICIIICLIVLKFYVLESSIEIIIIIIIFFLTNFQIINTEPKRWVRLNGCNSNSYQLRVNFISPSVFGALWRLRVFGALWRLRGLARFVVRFFIIMF